ncbi:MAG: hypothetical protein C0401_02940 [Anaerolinea sp.]|nr:hypothetical protein [Anaerolinea sp.]
MKNRKTTNLLFSLVLFILAALATVTTLNKSNARSLNNVLNETPTFDIALSVTQTISAILSSTQTAQPTHTFIPPTPTSLPPTPTQFVLPPSHYIRDINGNRQYYSIGCEASAAVDLAGYYDVLIYQYDFQIRLPHSDNPDLGFVGDVNGPWGQIPPAAYGVHATPVADLLNQFGVDVEGGKGYSLDQIKRKLAESKPVIVWVIGHMEYSEPVEYSDKQGNIATVAPYEHVVILTGYDKDSVRYLNNGKYADVPNDVFLNSWGVLGNMAVFHK